jgi:hypothetical protein
MNRAQTTYEWETNKPGLTYLHPPYFEVYYSDFRRSIEA